MNLIKRYISTSAVVILACYILMTLWWLSINSRGLIDSSENFYFGVFLGLLSVSGGLLGILKSIQWGGFTSQVGRAIIFLSSGLVTWGIGTLMIGYYNIALGQVYPYPSPADLAYILSWPLWFAGMFNLSQATGTRFQLRGMKGKLAALVIMIAAFAVSYYLLVVVARGGVFEFDSESYLRFFFDFAYPMGDVVILTSAALLFGLSFNYLGGALKAPILIILLGFVVNYTADIIFTYTNTIGTFYVAGWVDMLYLTAISLLGFGINACSTKLVRDSHLAQ